MRFHFTLTIKAYNKSLSVCFPRKSIIFLYQNYLINYLVYFWNRIRTKKKQPIFYLITFYCYYPLYEENFLHILLYRHIYRFRYPAVALVLFFFLYFYFRLFYCWTKKERHLLWENMLFKRDDCCIKNWIFLDGISE